MRARSSGSMVTASLEMESLMRFLEFATSVRTQLALDFAMLVQVAMSVAVEAVSSVALA